MSSQIYLIGPPGAGKSSVGIELAKILGLLLIDTDKEIESREKTSITDIFARYGESVFRDKETELLSRIAQGPRSVIACGGGIILREENRERMRDTGTVIYLSATTEELLDRISRASHRPLLSNITSISAFDDFLSKREPLYRETAAITIDVTDERPDKIAEIIRDFIKEEGVS